MQPAAPKGPISNQFYVDFVARLSALSLLRPSLDNVRCSTVGTPVGSCFRTAKLTAPPAALTATLLCFGRSVRCAAAQCSVMQLNSRQCSAVQCRRSLASHRQCGGMGDTIRQRVQPGIKRASMHVHQHASSHVCMHSQSQPQLQPHKSCHPRQGSLGHYATSRGLRSQSSRLG